MRRELELREEVGDERMIVDALTRLACAELILHPGTLATGRQMVALLRSKASA